MFATTSTDRPNRRRGTRLTALLAVPLLVGMLAACSPGGGPSNTPGNSGMGDTAELSFEDWQLQFASCMRDEGIDMPDPTAEGSGAIRLDEATAGNFQLASETCISEIGDPPAGPGGQMSEQEFLESQVKMAACFRENGIDVADPKKGQGFTVPQDVPDDVLKECMPGVTGGGAVSVAPAG